LVSSLPAPSGSCPCAGPTPSAPPITAATTRPVMQWSTFINSVLHREAEGVQRSIVGPDIHLAATSRQSSPRERRHRHAAIPQLLPRGSIKRVQDRRRRALGTLLVGVAVVRGDRKSVV